MNMFEPASNLSLHALRGALALMDKDDRGFERTRAEGSGRHFRAQPSRWRSQRT